MREHESPLWTFAAGSVTGARHNRSGAPNQDRAGLRFPDGTGDEDEEFDGAVLGTETVYVSDRDRLGPYVLAVADGHGGDRYTKSDRGAQLAVDAALHVLSKDGEAICSALATGDEIQRREIEENLSHRIVEVWRQKVVEDAGVADAPSATPSPKPSGRPHRPTQASRAQTVPYGTTLLAALVGAQASFYYQIGDGGVVVVDEGSGDAAPSPPGSLGGTYRDTEEVANDADVARPASPGELPDEAPRALRVFERDTRPGEETDSLCQPDPTQAAQVKVVVGPPPSLVLLATDGYEKAFTDEEGFLAAATDFLEILSQPGGEAVLSERLEGWLSDTSASGTGDDTSIALAYRSGTASVPEPTVPSGVANRSSLHRTVGATVILALLGLVAYALSS